MTKTFFRTTLIILLIIASSFIVTSPARAAGVLYAKPAASGTGDCSSWANACDLQTALTSASSGDEIWVAAGTHKPTSGTDRTISFVLKSGVTVYGGFAGTETSRDQRDFETHLTILSGDLNGDDNGSILIDEPTRADNSYHVVIASGTDNTFSLDGLAIIAGNANGCDCLGTGYGGGLYNGGGDVAISNVIFSANSAYRGGGMATVGNSNPVLTNVTFTQNTSYATGAGMLNQGENSVILSYVAFSSNYARGDGGGLYNSGNIFLSHVTFRRNSSYENGGGVYSQGLGLILSNVIFEFNSSGWRGGGLFSNTEPVLTNVAFIGNSASFRGGGMYNNGGSPILTNVLFKGNRASSVGGGGMYNNYGSPILENVTFSYNVTNFSGGGMYNYESSPTLTNVTFYNNSANFRGGGIFNMDSDPTLTNVIISNNPSGGDCVNDGSTLDPVSSHNLISDPANACGLVSGVNGNIIGSDPLLGTLEDYGGFTETIPLLAGSPAIDAGNDGLCPATDQRGVARPRGSHCDIGAYEYDQAPSTLNPADISFQEVIGGLVNPVFITHANDGSGRLFIIERGGRVRILKNGALLAAPFLDIQAIVKSTSGEQGLLGLAFDPDYANNSKFYVIYTAALPGDSSGAILTLRQYSASAGNPDLADPASGQTILTIDHPTYSNHNGGTLAFGGDGYLYWSTGDGGGGGDPDNNGQDLTKLLGKVLRIDVNSGSPYTIPASNPYFGNPNPNIKQEIWAYGLRNPWRMSFDRLTHDLYISDVGQNQREEINYQSSNSAGGENYGWRIMEGSLCYDPASGCDQTGKILPVAEYDHTLGCSVTGGYVYRGSSSPSLAGYYLYGDFCSGRLWAIYNNFPSGWTTPLQLADTSFNITTFGEDEQGELYLADYGAGKIYKISYQELSYTISGDAGASGVVLSYMDDGARSVETDSAGYYYITVPHGWSGTITPSKPGYGFIPADRTYINVIGNVFNENYDNMLLPEALSKISPSETANNQSLSPTLSWETSIGATSYEYCYSSAPGPCTKWNSVGTDTSVTLSGLAPNYTYYWQARAVNPGGTTEADNGTWWSFTTTAVAACAWPAYTPPASATFGDVPMTVGHWSWVERLANSTITAGCGDGNFCPLTEVNRAQMAVFLLRGKHCGSSYTPPAVGGSTGFGDVPLEASFAPWVKQLASEGITTGCGNGNFCPQTIVNRAQMAIFLLRAKHGATYSPPAVGASTGFGDVSLEASFAPWVKQLAAEGVTSGCGNGNFCPLQNVNRAQMAIFLVRTFNLP